MAVPSISHAKLMRGMQAALVATAVCGCGGLPSSLTDRELATGGTMRALAAGTDTAVVLLYAPSDCFVCYGALQPWLEWRRRKPGSVVIVFTRPPTRTERTELATYRIRADGILRPRLLDRVRKLETPEELLLVRGRLVAREQIRSGPLTTPLYRRFAHAAPPPGPIVPLRREQ